MGKGLLTLNPYHSDRFLLSKYVPVVHGLSTCGKTVRTLALYAYLKLLAYIFRHMPASLFLNRSLDF